MTETRQPWLKRPSSLILLIGAALLAAWMTTVIVSIASEEPDGEATLDGLSSAVRQALTDRDDGEFGRLVDSDSAGDDYAKNYVDRLGDADPRRIRATVSQGGGAPVITVTADARGKGTVCTAWSAVRSDDRWVLDAAPPVGSQKECGADAAG
ncbi:hypothetical protein [Streptomyces sp. NPDC047525]|uniref:hypothetical protein n=1 Tax=Streptomyces sp. NPDC047525 TaxID=3155264 RepID=UPI0033D24480